jgi:hypothetical protein
MTVSVDITNKSCRKRRSLICFRCSRYEYILSFQLSHQRRMLMQPQQPTLPSRNGGHWHVQSIANHALLLKSFFGQLIYCFLWIVCVSPPDFLGLYRDGGSLVLESLDGNNEVFCQTILLDETVDEGTTNHRRG